MSSRPPLRAVARARRCLARDHPALRRQRPTISALPDGRWRLRFHLSCPLPGGAMLRQSLIATINEAGELLRVVISR